MALKKQQSMLETFSMASMTDVVFLLLVFFMVTSTFIFPTGMEVNLPQSTEQTPLKPSTRIYVLPDDVLTVQYDNEEPQSFTTEEDLVNYILVITQQDPEAAIAIYADPELPYGRVIDVLNMGARNNIRMVLATVPGTGRNIEPANPETTAQTTPQGNGTDGPQ